MEERNSSYFINCDLRRQGFTTGRLNAAKTLLATRLINDVAEKKARHLNMPDIGIRLFFLPPVTPVDLSRFVYNKRKHSFLISRKGLTAITMIVNLCSELFHLSVCLSYGALPMREVISSPSKTFCYAIKKRQDYSFILAAFDNE